jgi:putative DNA primase/helicase
MTTTKTRGMVQAAQYYHDLGFNALPLKDPAVTKTKHPAILWKNGERDYTRERFSKADISTHAALYGHGIVGITGIEHNHDLDFDKVKDFSIVDEFLALVGLPLDYPWRVLSGSGSGEQIWINSPDPLPKDLYDYDARDKSRFDHVELRWRGNCCVLPPSVHPSGKLYQFRSGKYPTIPPADVPLQRILDALQTIGTMRYDEKPRQTFFSRASENDEYEQVKARVVIVDDTGDDAEIECPWAENHTDGRVNAHIWRNDGVPGFSCLHAHCKDIHSWRDLRVHVGLEVDLCSFDADDAGNADAMYALYGQDFLYCPSIGWMQYNGTHWRLDADGASARKASVSTLRRRRIAAVKDDRELIVKASKPSDRNVSGCLALFKIQVYADISSFDKSPDHLNFKNGVVDLRTGRIEPHSREQRFTYCVPVEYEDSDYTKWVDYLEGVIGGGSEIIDYLQMAIGYSLTGHTREEILFYLFGPTRSGKGTVAEVIMALLPRPISEMVDFNSFTAKREGDVSNFDLAPLKPARVIFASESNAYQSLNPAKIKQLTGGDHINCCFKHRDFFSYRPQFKVWLLSNHPVNGDPEDDALWGRVRVLSLPHSYLGREDKSKKAHLKTPEVLKGVAYWAVQGAIKWYALGAAGLPTPESISTWTTSHRDSLDYVQQWLDECCEENPNGWQPNDEVMASYTRWCNENNVQPKKGKGLALSLQTKGFRPAEIRKVGGKTKRGIGGLYVYPETYAKEENE